MTRSRTDVVAIRRRRRPDAAADVLAAWSQGQAAMVFEAATSDQSVAAALALVRPSALIHERPDGGRRLTRLADPRALDGAAAAIVMTSGTTGRPSAVVIGEDALRASTALGLRRLAARADEAWALSLPLDHIAGLLVLARGAATTGTAELHDVFAPDALAAGDATWWALVPTMLGRLLDLPRDLSERRVLLGGAKATSDLLQRARDRGLHVVTSYGMTETCGGCVYDGIPLDGVEIAIDPATTLIRIRGPVTAAARIDHDGTMHDVVDADGWHATSDLGRWQDGRLEMHGRADDVVISGGVNVSTAAIERALRALAGILDVAAIAVPDDHWGERVEAFVVTTAPDPDAWREAIVRELGREAVPARFHVVNDLPRGRLEKTDRAALLRQLEAD